MRTSRQRRALIGWSIGIAAFAVAAGSFALFFVRGEPQTIEARAREVVDLCSDANSRQACYDIEIPRLMNEGLSMEESFEVIRKVQADDPGYWFCHAGAHKISANEYYRDPSQWANVMTRCPVGICSNGCLHGTLQERFKAESLSGAQMEELLPDLQDICEPRENWSPTEQERASCYHEIGHLSMYLTGGDVVASGAVCDRMAVRPDGRDYRQTCYEGVFMQVFEPREPDDFALIYDIVPAKERLSQCDMYLPGVEKGACWKIGWIDGYRDFCDALSGGMRSACFREAWVVESDRLTASADAILGFCSYSDDAVEKRKCFNTLFYGVMATVHFDVEKMKPLCDALPFDVKNQCYANTASRMIETDGTLGGQALALCGHASEVGAGDACYAELAHYASFVFRPGSERFLGLCAGMPEPWRATCLRGEYE